MKGNDDGALRAMPLRRRCVRIDHEAVSCVPIRRLTVKALLRAPSAQQRLTPSGITDLPEVYATPHATQHGRRKARCSEGAT